MARPIRAAYMRRNKARVKFVSSFGAHNIPQHLSIIELFCIAMLAASLAKSSARTGTTTTLASTTAISTEPLYASCLGEARRPPQKIGDDSEQQHAPRQSLRLSYTRFVSQTTTAKKIVKLLKYSIAMQTVANKQKLRIA